MKTYRGLKDTDTAPEFLYAVNYAEHDILAVSTEGRTPTGLVRIVYPNGERERIEPFRIGGGRYGRFFLSPEDAKAAALDQLRDTLANQEEKVVDLRKRIARVEEIVIS